MDRLITQVTVTDPAHPLYGRTLDVWTMVSDRGPRWLTLRLPDGRRRNVRRDATDVVRPLPDSKTLPLVSARVLLRIAQLAEALSRRFEEETRDGQHVEHTERAQGTAPVALASPSGAAPSGVSDGPDTSAADAPGADAGRSGC